MKWTIMQFRQMPAALRVINAALLCSVLAGCNVGPKYIPPSATAPAAFKESPAQFKETDGWTVAQPQDATLRGKWWEIYNEPELNALEEELNIDNQNIQQAFENFMEARALVREARSQLFPTRERGRLLHPIAAIFQCRVCFQHRNIVRQADAGVFYSCRCVVGTRSLGQST